MASKRPPRLTEAFIRSIKVPCKRGDGHGSHGLTLVVRDRAGGGLRFIWRQIFTINGKKRSTGLGSHPLITLKMARDKAFENARSIALGEDILTPPPPKPPTPSLGEAFDVLKAIKAASAKRERTAKETTRMWNNSKRHCEPILVPSHICIDGYRDLSLMRASSVVKRQSTRKPCRFRRCSHAPVSCSRIS